MKTIILICLLILFVHPSAFGSTDCKIVEYPDHIDLICIGDEKAIPESSVPAIPVQSKTVETVAQNQVPPRPQMPESESATESSQKASLPSGTAAQQTNAPAAKTNKAAENLDKRRGLATRNASNLKNFSSATVHPGQ